MLAMFAIGTEANDVFLNAHRRFYSQYHKQSCFDESNKQAEQLGDDITHTG